MTGTIASDAGAPASQRVRVLSGLIVATVVITVTVLIGWTLHINFLKGVVPGLSTMNPMTAICLTLAAVALWLARDRRLDGNRQTIVLVIAICLFYVGATKLVDILSGLQLCPDNLLFNEQTEAQTPYPSRIAPNAAICFILISLALLALDRTRLSRLLHPQVLMIPVIALGLAAIVGYSYDASGFYTLHQFIPMALVSAIGFILLATVILFLRPNEGFVRLLPAGSSGARNIRRLLPACLLIPFLVGGLTLIGTDKGWWVGHGTDAAMVAVTTMVAMSVLALFNAVALNRTDSVRVETEMRLTELVAELDTRNAELNNEVRERRSAEEKAAHRAAHDFLTGLPNRLRFVDELEASVAHSFRTGEPLALVYIDLDNFKPVNDVYGHNAGDALLVAFARRLAGIVREIDTVARLGGDEFGVIVRSPITEQDALGLATRIAKATTRQYQLSPRDLPQSISVNIGVSMGIALLPGHATDLDDLVRVADGAMYRAKIAGKADGRLSNIGIAGSSLTH